MIFNRNTVDERGIVTFETGDEAQPELRVDGVFSASHITINTAVIDTALINSYTASVISDHVSGSIANFTTISASFLVIQNLAFANVVVTGAYAETGAFTYLTASRAIISNGVTASSFLGNYADINSISGDDAHYTYITTSHLKTTDFTSSIATIGNLTASNIRSSNISASNADFSTIDADSINVNQIQIVRANTQQLTASVGINANSITASVATIGALTSSGFNSSLGTITNLTATSISSSTSTIGTSTISTLNASQATISRLTASSLTSSNATIGSLVASTVSSSVSTIGNSTISTLSASVGTVTNLSSSLFFSPIAHFTQVTAANITSSTITASVVSASNIVYKPVSAISGQVPVYGNAVGNQLITTSVTIINDLIFRPLGQDGYQNPYIAVVAPSGSGDFTSISAALASGHGHIAVSVRPGNYYEQPMIIPDGLKLMAPDDGAFIHALNHTQPLITMLSSTKLNNFEIDGPTASSAIYISGSAHNQSIIVDKLRITNSLYGLTITGANTVVRAEQIIAFGCVTGSVIHAGATASIAFSDFIDNSVGLSHAGFVRMDATRFLNVLRPTNFGRGIQLENNAEMYFANISFQGLGVGIGSTFNVTRSIQGNGAQFVNCAMPTFILSGSGPIKVGSAIGDFSRAIFVQTSNLGVTAFDTKALEETYRTLSDMAVGSFVNGNQFATGEAGSSTPLICFASSSTGVWTDVTLNAVDYTAPPLTFPGTGSNNALYFALNVSKSNGIGQHIYGLDFYMNSTASYGANSLIAWETWNGSTWAAVTSMATQIGDGYYDLNTRSFDTFTTQSIRLNQNTIANSVKTTLPGFTGSTTSGSQFWVRARISNSLNSNVSIQRTKPYSNASVFGPDGFLTFHGAARNNQTFPWSIFGSQKNFTIAPADQPLGFGDNLSVGFLQNTFSSTSDKQIGFTNTLPLNLDTSTQASLRFSYRADTTDVGDIIFTVRYSYSQDGDSIYTSAGTAPTVAPRERTAIITASGPHTANATKTVFASLNLEGFPTRQVGIALSPVMWITIERTGTATADTYAGDINLFDISGRYTEWCLGGHAAFFT